MDDQELKPPRRTYSPTAVVAHISPSLARHIRSDRPAYARVGLRIANDLALKLARAAPGRFVYLIAPDGAEVTSARVQPR